MLDIIYFPISGILWFWHKAFGFIFGEGSGWAWALSIVFLVFTIRALLYSPTVRQIRTSRKMQEVQPLMKEVQKKYKNDRQRQALEMRKLQKEHGFNPLLGCLPMLVQIPVFIGLFHVLRQFNPGSKNYWLGVSEVESFLNARFLGSPLGASMQMAQADYWKFGSGGFSWTNIALIAVPLMIVAAVSTHMNARLSISRQSAEALANPQTAIMNRLMLWVFPLGILITGAFWHIGLLLYMMSNNLWTFGQQHLVFRTIDQEEREKSEAREQARADLAPKPGVKPVNPKKGGRVAAASDVAIDPADDEEAVVDTASEASASSPAGQAAKPAPGARPTGARSKKKRNRGRR